jgi:hypothetical protein
MVLCAGVSSVAAAQIARGVVRDSTAGTPLPSAVVLAIDANGTTIARTLTDSVGGFALALERADRLRFMRIGYTPRETRIDVAEAGAWNVVMQRIPPMLGTVRVAERGVCPGTPVSDGAATWRMWEQARAGLLSSVVARTTSPMTASSLVFNRRVSSFDHLVRRQTAERRDGTVERPFTAASPGRFAARGYLDEDASGRTFHGPDADVLLDESFVATHCFEVRAADARHRGQVGLAFRPTPERDTAVDVSGVLWFSGDGATLRSLEFRYTGLEPAAMKAEVGGEVGFQSLANGAIFVDRWTLRVPIMSRAVGAPPPPSNPPRGKSRRMINTSVRVAEIEEVGGVVLAALWQGGATWSPSVTGLSGVVREAGDDLPVAGAIIALDGIAQQVVSDRDGEFLFSLLPGRYTLTVTDTSLLRFASPRRTSQVIEVEHGELVRVSPRVESQASTVADACKGHQNARNIRLISGRAALPAEVLRARVSAAWALSSGDSARSETTVERQGRFLLCGPTEELRVALRVHDARFEADTTVVVGYTRSTAVDWRPGLRPLVQGAATRVVSGVVSDSGFRPVAAANVNGPGSRRAATDDEGRFRLRLDTREAAVLEIRRFGFAPTRLGVDAGGDTTVTATLLANTQQLEAVRVRAAAPTSAKLHGFEERLRLRERGITFGTFITEDQIERRNPTFITQMLLDIPSISVERVPPVGYAVFARGSTFTSRCDAAVFLDGVRVLGHLPKGEGYVAIDDIVNPAQIAGIEVYRTGFDAPPQFQALTSGCAVVVIWTK